MAETLLSKDESWLLKYWRPFMAWQYAAVCVFDFIVAPMMTMAYFKWSGGTYIAWEPLTLKESGFYHLSMAAIIGVAAWTRGQEKITRLNTYGEIVTSESSNTSQTPTGSQ
jgi:hypothetical protein